MNGLFRKTRKGKSNETGNQKLKEKNEREFTFMLILDDIGKSVTVTAEDHIQAEKELLEK